MVRSQPSFTPLFSAAIEGFLIHSCSRCTDSSWLFEIRVQIGSKSGPAAVAEFDRAKVAAPATAPWRKVRRSMGKEHSRRRDLLSRAQAARDQELSSNPLTPAHQRASLP